MIKVLHVYKTYFPEDISGIPRVIYGIAEGLADKGVETDVLTTGRIKTGAPSQMARHRVHVAKRHLHIASTSFSASLPGRFRRLSRKADIIHYHFPWPVADCLHLAMCPRKPTVLTYHSDIVKQRIVLPLYRPVMHAFLRRMDRIVATSENYAISSPTLNKFASRTTAIPIGIPERSPPANAYVDAWRASVGESFFLFVGTTRYYKGLTFLIQAAKQTGLPVVIAGAGYQELARTHQMPDNVRFVGEVTDEDKEVLLELAQAFVFPSHLRSEAFGIALLEAARAGKPMISCEIGTGTSFVNLANVTGQVVPPASSDAIAEAMARLAAHEDERFRFGRAARARYEDLFRQETMAEGYLTIYEDVLRKRS